ncbi:hypothetical protein [Novosphingobium colocasiae]|uniref:hypothetical protein n=1 Tax=Novosphingobium colocasiae TaxID=1256513 RepID=UPI0035B0EB6B
MARDEVMAAEMPAARLAVAVDTRAPLRFALFFLIALALRWPVLGDWNWYSDDQFYALVGERMAAGDLLYVDIWDRKGPALFALYALIAMVSHAPLAWQLAATLAAAAGACGVYALSRLIGGPRGAYMAATAYLALMIRFDGSTGEAAVFYNPLVMLAAWSVATRLDALRTGTLPLRVVAGMAAAGLAIAFKPTALFESLWFGATIAVLLWRSGMAPGRLVAALAMAALAGALPWLLTGLWYLHLGHFADLWQATVASNFHRQNLDPHERTMRALALLGQLGLPILCAVLGEANRRRTQAPPSPALRFLSGWCLVSFVAVLGYPNIFTNYALPMLAPLCVLGVGFYQQRSIAPLLLAAIVISSLAFAHIYELPTRWRARAQLAAFERHVRAETPYRRLLVIGHTSLLYARIGARPPSVLAFPRHLYDGAEAGSSGIDEVAEMRRILAARPETVVIQDPLRANPVNEANLAAVNAYVRRCRAVRAFALSDKDGPVTQTVYSRCAP